MKPTPFRAILQKEVKAYFNTPAAYIVSGVFLLLTGYFFSQTLFLANRPNLVSIAGLIPLLWVFFIPAITMRLIAEELKNGTIELLSTFPVDEREIILAKYTAALILITMTLAITFPYPLTLAFLGTVDWGGTLGMYAGLWLTGAMMAGFGILASTLTRNQIIAFIIGLLFCFVFFLIGKVSQFAPLGIQDAISYMGIDSHLDRLERGLFDTRDMIYFLGLTFIALFGAILNLRSRRWR